MRQDNGGRGNLNSSIKAGILPEVKHNIDDPYSGRFSISYGDCWYRALVGAGFDNNIIPIPMIENKEILNAIFREIDCLFSFGSTADVASFKDNKAHDVVKNRFMHNNFVVQEALDKGKPYLSACGSYQFSLKYLLGASKLEEYILLKKHGNIVDHHAHDDPTIAAHQVRITDENSILGKIASKRDENGNLVLGINSTHKQGIEAKVFYQDFGDNSKSNSDRKFYITPTAISDDGIVEAFEVRSKTGDLLLWAGTQFHPEINKKTSFGKESDEWAETCQKYFEQVNKEVSKSKNNKPDLLEAMEDLKNFIRERNAIKAIEDLKTKDSIKEPYDECSVTAQMIEARQAQQIKDIVDLPRM